MMTIKYVERLVFEGEDMGVRVTYEANGGKRYADIGLDDIKPYTRPEYVKALGETELKEVDGIFVTDFEKNTGVQIPDFSDNVDFCQYVGKALATNFNTKVKQFNVKAVVKNSSNEYTFVVSEQNALLARKKAKEQVAGNLGVALDSVKILQCVVKV